MPGRGMDGPRKLWHFPDMTSPSPIPAWQLYGEDTPFPDVLHIERIIDRAAGLDWTIAPHRHLHLHQLFLLRSGQITLQVDGRTLRPEAPVLLNLPPGSVHGFSFSAGTEGHVLTLPVKDHPELFGRDSRIGALAGRVLLQPPSPEAAGMFADLMRCWAGDGPFREVELRARVALILCRVLETAPEGQNPRAADPRFARFEALVRARLREHWLLDRFAAELNLSARHLNRLCHNATGLSARAYIEAQLIHEACRLLAYTRMSVQEIAWQLGYGDPSYFSRSFRRRAGRSPLDYRRSFEG